MVAETKLVYKKRKRQLDREIKFKKLFLERVIFFPIKDTQEYCSNVSFQQEHLKSSPSLAYSFIFNSFFVSYLWLPEFTGTLVP